VTDPSRRTRTDRALYLSGFVYLLAPDRVRLDRAILALHDSDDGLPDREVILRAVEQVWPHTRATTGECRARSLFLPGTPGRGRQAGRLRTALRALSSNGPTRSGVVGLREQERARAHGYEPECAKAAQWSGRDSSTDMAVGLSSAHR
jgi:hypothetical protein